MKLELSRFYVENQISKELKGYAESYLEAAKNLLAEFVVLEDHNSSFRHTEEQAGLYKTLWELSLGYPIQDANPSRFGSRTLTRRYMEALVEKQCKTLPGAGGSESNRDDMLFDKLRKRRGIKETRHRLHRHLIKEIDSVFQRMEEMVREEKKNQEVQETW